MSFGLEQKPTAIRGGAYQESDEARGQDKYVAETEKESRSNSSALSPIIIKNVFHSVM